MQEQQNQQMNVAEQFRNLVIRPQSRLFDAHVEEIVGYEWNVIFFYL
jgi:hypothetical protein